jgi:calcium/calmodulin-dependent protein kinase I
VYKALDKRKNQLIALKVIKRKTLCKESIELLRSEADLLHSLKHSNIVTFKHVSIETYALNLFGIQFREIKGQIFLAMELMKGGPLTDLIKQRKASGSGFTDEESAQVMKCIFSAMEYMHSHNIVHRDLKPGK